MEKIKALIVDDDRQSIEVLKEGLMQHPDVEVISTAVSMSQGFALIKEHKPDILFLDIELNDASGLQLLEALSGDESLKDMKTVFYTSYNKYLIQAIRYQAFDFILKPFDASDLLLILNRYRMMRADHNPSSVCAETTPVGNCFCNEEKKLSVTTITNDKIILSISDILYFKYDSNSRLWEMVLNTLQRFILKRHTTAEVILSVSSSLVRTHKSFILNISYLSRITSNGCVLLPPYDNISELKISKAYKRQLMDRFFDI